jgi:ribosomal protein S28E/S33
MASSGRALSRIVSLPIRVDDSIEVRGVSERTALL